jgi:hypothetical protein
MLEDLDEEDAKKVKYVLLFGIAMVIFMFVLLWLMEMTIPTKKKKNTRADVTLHQEFRF